MRSFRIARPGLRLRTREHIADPSHLIADVAQAVGADAIVRAMHGRNPWPPAMGSGDGQRRDTGGAPNRPAGDAG
jgi:hypothetical protein